MAGVSVRIHLRNCCARSASHPRTFDGGSKCQRDTCARALRIAGRDTCKSRYTATSRVKSGKNWGFYPLQTGRVAEPEFHSDPPEMPSVAMWRLTRRTASDRDNSGANSITDSGQCCRDSSAPPSTGNTSPLVRCSNFRLFCRHVHDSADLELGREESSLQRRTGI